MEVDLFVILDEQCLNNMLYDEEEYQITWK